jgi:hypothetical protein
MNDETGLLVSLWPVNHYRYMLLCGGAPEPEPTHSNFRERKKTSTVLVSCVVLQNRNRTDAGWLLRGKEGTRRKRRHIAPSSTGSPFPTTTRGSSQFSSAPSRATASPPLGLRAPSPNPPTRAFACFSPLRLIKLGSDQTSTRPGRSLAVLLLRPRSTAVAPVPVHKRTVRPI